MNKKPSQIITLFLCCILLIVTFSGCIKNEQKSEESKETLQPDIKLDQPSILPDWKDGEYHDYYGTMDLLQEFQIIYPDLVNIFSIGKSVLGKDIWCIKVTNEKNYGIKSSCLIDGCIHGCEWEAGDACLFLTEYLLVNFDANKTITHILNSSEIYIVPLLNPDGRQVDYRFNDNGIDLNRNFDIDFGRLRGYSIPLGRLFGRIKIPHLPLNPKRDFTLLHKLFPSIPAWFTNCGRRPFSEPETQAIRDLMRELKKKDFSFYLDCHTAGQYVGSPWEAFKPPFEISKQELYIYDYAKEWIAKNTEYENAGVNYMGASYVASGTVTDWCYKEFRIPSFGLEILPNDYEPSYGRGKHDNLVHWMETTIPVFIYLIINIDNLRQWKTPDIQPSLPEGVPPEPLK